MRKAVIYSEVVILAVVVGIWLLCITGCAYNTQKEKHFYLGYGQKGYLHYPTDKPNTWLTVEIEAAGWEGATETFTDDEVIIGSPIE